MHIVMLVIGGLIVLAVFFFGARLINRSGQNGAAVFIWVWLLASIVNGAVGVMRAGIPVINEIGGSFRFSAFPRRWRGISPTSTAAEIELLETRLGLSRPVQERNSDGALYVAGVCFQGGRHALVLDRTNRRRLSRSHPAHNVPCQFDHAHCAGRYPAGGRWTGPH